MDARLLQEKKINVKIQPLESTFSAVTVMTELGSSKNREFLTFVRILKMPSGLSALTSDKTMSARKCFFKTHGAISSQHPTLLTFFLEYTRIYSQIGTMIL